MSKIEYDILNKQEDLLPELKNYLEKDKLLGEIIRHPLIFSVPHFPQLNALINLQFQEKKRLLKIAEKNEDWGTYLFLHEKPYRLQAFSNIEQNLSNKKYWSLLSELWVNSENIWQNFGTWKLFLQSSRPGKYNFMKASERKLLRSLPRKVKVYRGFIPGKNKEGFSYTLSKEKALWFSNRWNKGGEILSKIVEKEKIFAYLNSRGEDEIILL